MAQSHVSGTHKLQALWLAALVTITEQGVSDQCLLPCVESLIRVDAVHALYMSQCTAR